MMMFFATGSLGIVIGLSPIAAGQGVIITFMGVINIGLGAFFAFLFITQVRKDPDKRKKKKHRD
ncbi:MAG: hypothetical protein HOK63_05430 [Thaumarchaeota archaeon]|nr:hypothetical protein [Nitrososphaerota archaeon]MBT5842697.1 hypothetical protein [Nitrososphaerota archaeon]MBT6469073.1 hypothetical protein [Nitrososphaerota archaeon]